MKRLLSLSALALCLFVSCGGTEKKEVNKKPESIEKQEELPVIEGLKIKREKPGTGDRTAENGDRVKVHYAGWLENGKKFDSSVERGTPFEFVLGQGRVIQGWEKGIPGMKVGEKRKLTIDHKLAYGERGFPGAIPPKARLIFDVELLEIN